MSTNHPVHLIAVVGGTGAGKGWFVERLCRQLGSRATHLQLDSFYRDRSHLPMARRAQLNFDIPEAIDWEQAERVLVACRAGGMPSIPRYDFATYSRLPDSQPSKLTPIVFVDGLWLLRPPAVRKLFSLKIYLDTPEAVRRTRRLQRDVSERGYTPEVVESRYRMAASMHDRHVAPQKKWADLVLAQPFREAELNLLASRLWDLFATAAFVPAWEHETFRAELNARLTNHEYCN